MPGYYLKQSLQEQVICLVTSDCSLCVIALLGSTVVIRQVGSTVLGRPWKPKGL